MTRFPRLVLLASITLTPAALCQGSFVTLTPPGNQSLRILDCSDDGQVLCGWSLQGFTVVDSWIWSATQGFTSLGANPLDSRFPRAERISDDGSTVVGRLPVQFTDSAAFRWTASGGLEVLQSTGNPTFPGSLAVACDESGDRVGGFSTSASFTRPVIWDANGLPTILPVFPGTNSGRVLGMSRSGVAVGRQVVGGVSKAFRWSDADGLQALPSPGVEPATRAQWISRDGTVAFGVQGSPGNVKLVRWNASGVPEVLDVFPPGLNNIEVAAVDEHGRSAVGRFISSGPVQSFHWSESDGLRSMEQLAADAGISLGVGGRLDPLGMSADGSVIVGNREFAVQGAFILTLDSQGKPEIGVDVCDPPVANSTGASPLLRAFGSLDPAGNDLVLFATDLPAQTFGIVAVSRTTALQPNLGGGLGTLCLGSPLGRYVGPGEVRSTGPFGRMSFRIDTAAIPDGPGSVAALPGESWTFQFWHRDVVQGAATSNLTAARTVTFH